MPELLKPLLAALDAAPAPVSAFVRDDDAGWADDSLFALLDTARRCSVPVDLATIPAATGPQLAEQLCVRIDALPHLLGVHQHGHTHMNHQSDGRNAEFGDAHAQAEQRDALQRGRARLQRLFGARLLPVFTPPWNRCAAYTPGLLAGLGYAALSRDRGARPQQDLPELPVDVDWSRHHRHAGAAGVAAAMATAVRARCADGRPLGLMLHHAAMDPAELALLERLLDTLAAHPKLRWRPMAALLPAAGTQAPIEGAA
jgi:hypothetical protein